MNCVVIEKHCTKHRESVYFGVLESKFLSLPLQPAGHSVLHKLRVRKDLLRSLLLRQQVFASITSSSSSPPPTVIPTRHHEVFPGTGLRPLLGGLPGLRRRPLRPRVQQGQVRGGGAEEGPLRHVLRPLVRITFHSRKSFMK